MAAGPALVGIVLFVAACAAPRIGIFHGERVADLALYQEFGDRVLSGRIPYRDFSVEYPPGSLPAFVLPSLAPAAHYVSAFRATMAACGVVALAALAVCLVALHVGRRRQYASLAFAGTAPLLLGPTMLNRFDLWPTALTEVALAAILLGFVRTGFGTLGLGATAKVYPLALLPLFALARGREERRRGLLAFVLVVAVVIVPFLLVGPGGIRFSVRNQLERPLQVESLGGSLVWLADRVGLASPGTIGSYGSQNVTGALAHALELATGVLLVTALVAVWLLYARGPREGERLAHASVAAVAAWVAFGKVLSPQYLIWLIPLVPLARSRLAAPACALLAAALALTRGWFPSRYDDVARLGDATALVLARNAVLVSLFVLLALGLRFRENA
jgi:hypothetical protein